MGRASALLRRRERRRSSRSRSRSASTTRSPSRCRTSRSGGRSRSSPSSSSRPSSGSSTLRCRSGARRAPAPGRARVGVLAVVLEVADFDVLANFAKLAAVTLLAFWFLELLRDASAWVVLVALIIPWSTSTRSGAGRRSTSSRSGESSSTTLSFAFPVPGEQNTAQLGLPDLLFFALFLAATARWGLRTPADVGRDGPLLRRDDGPRRLLRRSNGLPALPLLCARLPRSRTPTCSGEGSAPRRVGRAPTRQREPAARFARAARPSRCAACAGTCPRAARARACSPTRPGAP